MRWRNTRARVKMCSCGARLLRQEQWQPKTLRRSSAAELYTAKHKCARRAFGFIIKAHKLRERALFPLYIHTKWKKSARAQTTEYSAAHKHLYRLIMKRRLYQIVVCARWGNNNKRFIPVASTRTTFKWQCVRTHIRSHTLPQELLELFMVG